MKREKERARTLLTCFRSVSTRVNLFGAAKNRTCLQAPLHVCYRRTYYNTLRGGEDREDEWEAAHSGCSHGA